MEHSLARTHNTHSVLCLLATASQEHAQTERDTHTHSPSVSVPVRMWIWGRLLMRVLVSRGPTTITLTSPSPTTTWTAPSKRYRLPWTNSAPNHSGSPLTGSTEPQPDTVWLGQLDRVCSTTEAGERTWERGLVICGTLTGGKATKPSAASSLLTSCTQCNCFLLETRRERVLKYFSIL